MAIEVTKEEGGIIKIKLDNGHALALEKVTTDFNIVNEKEAIGFILSVMRDADGKEVQTANGSFVPAERIKKGGKDDIAQKIDNPNEQTK